MRPQDVDGCSLWQFMHAVDGWMTAQSGGKRADPPSDDEFEEMLKRHG